MRDDMTEAPVISLVVSTPFGRLTVFADALIVGRTLWLEGLHIQDLHANAVGTANLRAIARALMEGFEFDELVIEGALRTTGAGPGRRPGRIRFTRELRPAPDSGGAAQDEDG